MTGNDIIALSVVGLGVFLALLHAARYFHQDLNARALGSSLRKIILSNDVERAVKLCKAARYSPLAQIAEKALEERESLRDIPGQLQAALASREFWRKEHQRLEESFAKNRLLLWPALALLLGPLVYPFLLLKPQSFPLHILCPLVAVGVLILLWSEYTAQKILTGSREISLDLCHDLASYMTRDGAWQ